MKEAIRHGYTVTELYRAWHWNDERWSSELFAGYIRLFMKIKIESSEFPAGIVTDEEKQKWVEGYKRSPSFYLSFIPDLYLFRNLNIEIVPSKVVPNPGLRFISKLLLNSLWVVFKIIQIYNRIILRENILNETTSRKRKSAQNIPNF